MSLTTPTVGVTPTRRPLVRVPAVLLAVALVACASASAPPPALPRAQTGRIEVTVNGFESDTGQALMSVFLDETGWPDDEQAAHAAVALPIRDRRVVTEFTDVPPGSFAVAVFHDEDLDEALDRNFFGIPREAYGFSRDARGRFGPPRFDEARLEIGAGDSMQITIEVR